MKWTIFTTKDCEYSPVGVVEPRELVHLTALDGEEYLDTAMLMEVLTRKPKDRLDADVSLAFRYVACCFRYSANSFRPNLPSECK